MVKLDNKNREQYIKIILNALHEGKRRKFLKTFLELHPSDQSDIFMMLDESARERVYTYIKPIDFAEIFEGLHVNNQVLFLEELSEKYATIMFNNMFADNIVTLLAEVSDEESQHILSKMDQEKARKVKSLLSYEDETAGAIMTKEFISVSSNDVAANVIERLRKDAPDAEIIYYNYVIDEAGKLVGVVSLRDLIVAAPHEIIANIMSTRVVSVPDDMDQEEVGNIIQKYDFLAAPVISKENRLLGIVTVDDVMDILEDEATEDFGEISAAKGTTDINVGAFKTATKRAPWIIALMFFGLITAEVIGQFEETLEAVVLLAVFIPMIMDSAGNVGTQSLAVAVRGLALKTIERDSFWKMIRREFSTGIILGIVSMLVITILIAIRYDFNWMLALIVGFSILVTLSVSTVIGSTVPLIINKLKLDPAIASGPFITTLNDILGLLIYFSIATSLMNYL